MDRALGMLGLCRRAGALELGEQAVRAAARRGRAQLILTASDAGGSSGGRAQAVSAWSGAAHMALPYTKEELGALVGRRVCALMAITDIGLAAGFAEKLAQARAEYLPQAQQLAKQRARLRAGKQKGRNAHG